MILGVIAVPNLALSFFSMWGDPFNQTKITNCALNKRFSLCVKLHRLQHTSKTTWEEFRKFNYLGIQHYHDTKQKIFIFHWDLKRQTSCAKWNTGINMLSCLRVHAMTEGWTHLMPPSFTTPTQPHINYISCHCRRIDFSLSPHTHIFSLFLGT